MAGAFTAVDLSQLPAPDVIDEISFEDILASALADLVSRAPEFDALVESDPTMKAMQVASYVALLTRQRINEAARAVMLAYAAGADLDQIGANFSVARLTLDPGDAAAVPPVPAIYESDTDLRRRVQLSPEAYTVAGSAASYVFHALGADPEVRDAEAVSPAPGVVTIYVLSRVGSGAASVDLIDAVAAVLSADTVRPMTDSVVVQSASVTEYQITAALTVYPGPDAEIIRATSEEAALAYAAAQHRLGYDVTLSGIYAALHQAGVQNVALASPAAGIVMGDGEAAFCTAVTVTIGGVDV
jgi:phage-related baseplate assembly protein